MMRAGLSLLVIGVLAGVFACDAGEVVVFSANAAGSAGENALAGMGGGASDTAVPGFSGSAGEGSGGTSGAGGSGGNSLGKSCQTTDDCDQAWFCDKQACADPTGICIPVPLADDPVQAPVCDCDKTTTYWNDTLRQQKGVPASTPGACAFGAQPCIDDHDCGADPDAHCSRQLRDFSACAAPGAGQCWVTPSDCPANDKAYALPCQPPGSPGPLPTCLTLCQAINLGAPFIRKKMDSMCP